MCDRLPCSLHGGKPSIKDPAKYLVVNVVAIITDVMGQVAMLDRLRDQPGEVLQTWANIGRKVALLDCRPQTTLADGIGKVIAWLREGSFVDLGNQEMRKRGVTPDGIENVHDG